MVVAITGATGFIGRYLTTYLVGRGLEVRAIVRPGSPNAAAAGAAVMTAPLNADALADAFAGVDSVVHLAGIVSAVRSREYTVVNVEGTRAVAAAARKASARLIHVSSLAAAGPASPAAPRHEDDAPNPVTPYGRSKLESEHIVRSTDDLDWTILRPGVVYGPGDRGMLPLFQFAKRGFLPLVGRRSAAYTFVYVHDMVRAVNAALETHTRGETMFVGHARPVTARELVETLRDVVGRFGLVVPVPALVAQAAGRAGDVAGMLTGRPALLNKWRMRELFAEGFVSVVDRLRDRLGITADVDLHEGITKTADWYKKERWL